MRVVIDACICSYCVQLTLILPMGPYQLCNDNFMCSGMICADLDLGRLATGFGLLHLPKMPELKDKDVLNFEPIVMDYSTISFKLANYAAFNFRVSKIGPLNKN